MENFVRQFLFDNNLADSSSCCIVGFSGGSDSLCLLHIMKKLRAQTGFRLVAAHLNHNWRGEESLKEQRNCEKFCKDNGIEFFTKTLNDNTDQTELVAREARYGFFKLCAQEYNASGIFTAHTASDNAHTVIYRLAKGTGIKGCAGISKVKNFEDSDKFSGSGLKIFRPLLDFYTEDIANYCKSNNLSPDFDSSNENLKYARNFIRSKIIPDLKTINPKVEKAVNNFSKIARSESAIVKEYLDKIRSEIFEGDKIRTSKFLTLSKDVKQKLVSNLFVELDLEHDYKCTMDAVHFIETNCESKNGKLFSLSADLWLFVSDKFIHPVDNKKSAVIAENQELIIDSEGEYNLSENYVFSIKKWDEGVELKNFPSETDFCAVVDLKKISFPFCLRIRKDGDIIQPFGMSGKMKLKKYFINKYISRLNRDRILLLCKENEVLWAIGAGLSEKLRVKSAPSHFISLVKKDDGDV